MTIQEVIKFAIKKLKKTKSTSPALDAEVLLSHLLDKPKEYLLTNPEQSVSPKLEKQFHVLLSRRIQGWPVAYLTRQKEFHGLSFYVDKNVLIPRPETEGLVDLVCSFVRSSNLADKINKLSILDIGTGSGNFIISLAKKLGAKNRYFASDISPAALKVAKKNAEHHKTHVLFKQSDILKAWKNQHFDIIIANLPYLDRETDASTKFEPKLALIADKKGLAVIEELFKTLPSTLRPHPSVLFLEIGHDQGEALKKLAKKYLPASPEGGPAFETKIYKDLSGHARYAIIQSNIV